MNIKIRNATEVKFKQIGFKSKLEKIFYETLTQQGFNPQYEPKTFTLWDGFTPITPFYDKETSKHKKVRVENGDRIKSTILVPKQGKIIGIKYTPDFYFKYKDYDIYIEAKGKENDVFYIKKKLFIKYLDEILKTNGTKSLYFEVYTKKQLLQVIDIIKEYGK